MIRLINKTSVGENLTNILRVDIYYAITRAL